MSRLNGIIHPAVKRYILKSLEEQKKEGRKLCVVEAALFLEEHYQEFCDEVWYIHTDEEIRIQRLMKNRAIPGRNLLELSEIRPAKIIFEPIQISL